MACNTVTTLAGVPSSADASGGQPPGGRLADFQAPFAVQFNGSALAKGLLHLFGWRVQFEGLPARRGVVVVYPHTSNWDFVVLMLAKWSVGIQVSFWGKDKLFAVPMFGRWLRWLGGVPVDRTAPRGMVGQAVQWFADKKRLDEFFWLGLAPEGTRKHIPGWRTGFYLTALQADVPLGLVQLDYGRRCVRILDFIRPSGDADADMRRIAIFYDGVAGRNPDQAAPIALLAPTVARIDTIVK